MQDAAWKPVTAELRREPAQEMVSKALSMLSYADRTGAVTSRPAAATLRTTMADELVCSTLRPVAFAASAVRSRITALLRGALV